MSTPPPGAPSPQSPPSFGGEDAQADAEHEGETDHGVPFPGSPVDPVARTDCAASLRRGARVDWGALFGRATARRVVDLGCGNGRFLLGAALAHPEADHLGVDLVPQAIQHAARRAGERGLGNVRYAWGDARELLYRGLEPDSVDELHVYHPQPYYDEQEIERRLLMPAFFGRAWTALRKPDGVLVVQTDNPAYWRYLSRSAPRLFAWEEQPLPWPDAPEGRTRREILARQQGLAIMAGLGRPLALHPRQARARVARLEKPTFDANKPGFRGAPRGRGPGPAGPGRGRRGSHRGQPPRGGA